MGVMQMRKINDNKLSNGDNCLQQKLEDTNNTNKNNNNVRTTFVKLTVKDEGKQRLSVRRSSRLDHHHYFNHVKEQHHVSPRGGTQMVHCCHASAPSTHSTLSRKKNSVISTIPTSLVTQNTIGRTSSGTISDVEIRGPTNKTTYTIHQLRQPETSEIYLSHTNSVSTHPHNAHLTDDQLNGNIDINLELHSNQKQNSVRKTEVATIETATAISNPIPSSTTTTTTTGTRITSSRTLNNNIKRGKRSLSSTRIEKEKSDEKNIKLVRKTCGLRNHNPQNQADYKLQLVNDCVVDASANGNGGKNENILEAEKTNNSTNSNSIPAQIVTPRNMCSIRNTSTNNVLVKLKPSKLCATINNVAGSGGGGGTDRSDTNVNNKNKTDVQKPMSLRLRKR